MDFSNLTGQDVLLILGIIIATGLLLSVLM